MLTKSDRFFVIKNQKVNIFLQFDKMFFRYIQMYHFANDYRFITQKMDTAEVVGSEKHLKSKFSWLHYKITQNSSSKEFIKAFPTYFS